MIHHKKSMLNLKKCILPFQKPDKGMNGGKILRDVKTCSPVPFVIALILGAVLYAGGHMHGISDVFFALGSGFLIVGLIRMLGNLKMFASFNWSFRFIKRLFTGRAGTGREETEDYARYRERLGGHADAKILLILAAILIGLAAVAAVLVHKF